jgi:hypothetical protein
MTINLGILTECAAGRAQRKRSPLVSAGTSDDPLSSSGRRVGRSRAALRGAARSRGPMRAGNLLVARRGRSRFDDGRLAGAGSDGVR